MKIRVEQISGDWEATALPVVELGALEREASMHTGLRFFALLLLAEADACDTELKFEALVRRTLGMTQTGESEPGTACPACGEKKPTEAALKMRAWRAEGKKRKERRKNE